MPSASLMWLGVFIYRGVAVAVPPNWNIPVMVTAALPVTWPRKSRIELDEMTAEPAIVTPVPPARVRAPEPRLPTRMGKVWLTFAPGIALTKAVAVSVESVVAAPVENRLMIPPTSWLALEVAAEMQDGMLVAFPFPKPGEAFCQGAPA